jgi:protein SCO1/2
MPPVHHRLAALALLAVVGGAERARASAIGGPEIGEATIANTAPPELVGVDVTERLEARLPLDATLRDEHGAPIRLGDAFGDGLPVIVTFNYSSCPMLCNVMLGGLTATLHDLDWTAGKQFRVVTIGLDPRETPDRARATRDEYLRRYGRPVAADGWRFLTGSATTVRAIADAAGFGYTVAPSGEVLHPAVLILVSSEGVISRYVYGVEFDRAELRGALASTALGTITPSTAKFLHACFDLAARKGSVALEVMRAGGVVFLIGLAGVFVVGRIRSARGPEAGPAGSPRP